MKNILIVGQGLAGTVLAHQLLAKNYTVSIIDKGHSGISSTLAAGVVNPVTGRRIVKSWLMDDLLPIAKKYYQEVGQELGFPLWYELPALRLFTDTGMSNNWGIRKQHIGYERYLGFAEANTLSKFPIKESYGAGIIHFSARANISKMITAFRQKWQEEQRLSEESFDFEQLKSSPDSIQYKGKAFSKIIFCEGWEGQKNPFFSNMPFQVTKGEVLLLRIPNFPEENIIKKKVALVPLGDHLFWAGATNYWEFANNQPSEEGKDWLKTEIDAILDTPYQVVDHLAAIRPTIRHRRPIIGFPTNLEANQIQPRIGIFNGFGTKGTSLVPYWANQFIQTIEKDIPLSKEVDVNYIKIKS